MASVFSFASGTSQFIDKIKSLLEDIVISRNFLSNIDSSSKREAIKAIIKPSDFDKSIYQNIGSYYDEQITKTLSITNKSVRSNYHVVSNVYYDNEKQLVALYEKISYRLYPSAEGFADIVMAFSEENVPSICHEVIICSPNGEREEQSLPVFEDTLINDKPCRIAKINLEKIGNNVRYLDVELNLTSYGQDHWFLIGFRLLQPTEGFKYHLTCSKDVIIAEHQEYFHDVNVFINEREKQELSLSSSQWITEGSGLVVLAQKASYS